MRDRTENGIEFEDWLVGSKGMAFELFPKEDKHSKQDVQIAKAWLKANRDVVGSIQVTWERSTKPVPLDKREPKPASASKKNPLYAVPVEAPKEEHYRNYYAFSRASLDAFLNQFGAELLVRLQGGTVGRTPHALAMFVAEYIQKKDKSN